MKSKLCILLLVFSTSSEISRAQTQELDSLLRELNNYKKEDSSKIKLLDNVIEAYISVNPNIAFQYAAKEIILAQKLPDRKYLAGAYIKKGRIFFKIADFLNALEYYQNALNIYEDLDNKRDIEFSLWSIGQLVLSSLSNELVALHYFQKGLSIAQNIDDKEYTSLFLNEIGVVYRRLSDEKKALEYSQKALAIRESIGDKVNTGNTLNSIGVTYRHFHNFPKALEYFQKALNIHKIIDSRIGVCIELGNISDVYEALGNYTKAIKYLGKALIINKSIGDNAAIANTYIAMSQIYLKQKNYKQAINYARLTMAIANNIGILDNQEDALKTFGEAYTATKQYRSALKFYKQYIVIKDSINNTRLQKKITQLQLQNDFHKKEDSLKLQQTLRDEKFKQQETLNILKQRQQWLYVSGGLIILGFGIFYFFYRARLQQARLKTEMAATKIEQQQKEVEFQRRLGDISLSALRSQMNPHFVFNCLNSIKLYTTQNDTVAASEYLSKFSKLIRLVMENSRNDRISLASELNTLRLYIELEAMRFKEKLEYNIKVENDVEADYIEIPPLLLQPYVENAIWHGLMHKEEGGKIDINVTIHNDESLLEIKITDNGVGRAKAVEMRSKTGTQHKSYGMKVTSERIALINQIYKTGANVRIHDLMHDNSQPAGTMVIIKIPV